MFGAAEKAGIGVLLIVIIIAVMAVIGWGLNIIKLTKCDFEAPYKAEVIRCIGIIPVVGAVAGYCNIRDGKKE